MYKCKFVLILFFITFPFFSYSNETVTGIIKERMEKFQESKNLMRTINKNLSGNNFNVIIQSAEKLNIWANEMHQFFPNSTIVPQGSWPAITCLSSPPNPKEDGPSNAL